MFKIGDRVFITDKLQFQFEGEEELINQSGTILEVQAFTFPYKVKFDNDELQEKFGERSFDEFELKLIRRKMV